MRLDVVSQTEADGTAYHLLYDGHGSTRALLDGDAAVVEDAENNDRPQLFAYDAYGNMLGLPDYAAGVQAALTSLLYSGEQTDGNGLQYLRAHYYDPATGRFNRLDPFACQLCASGMSYVRCPSRKRVDGCR